MKSQIPNSLPKLTPNKKSKITNRQSLTSLLAARFSGCRRLPLIHLRCNLQHRIAVGSQQKSSGDLSVHGLRVQLQIICFAAVSIGQFLRRKLLPSAQISAGGFDRSCCNGRQRRRHCAANRVLHIREAHPADRLAVLIDERSIEPHARQVIKVGRFRWDGIGIESKECGRRQRSAPAWPRELSTHAPVRASQRGDTPSAE